MQATSESQRKAVSSHIADSESIEAGRAGEDEVFVVTDSRVLSMQDTEEDGRSVRNIKSTNLTGGVRSIEIEEKRGKEMLTDKVLTGGFVLLIGAVSLFYGVTNLDTNTAGIGILLGLVCSVVGGLIVYDGFDTPDGKIKVEITTDAGEDTYWLREDESDIAGTVSEVVGKNSSFR